MDEREIPSDALARAGGQAQQNGIVIAVVRSGGLAGLRRRWRVEPDADQAPHWLQLVQRCPWDDPLDPSGPGADRYLWSIHARLHDEQLQQVVPDALMQGAWRDLVDAVRAADSTAP